MCRDSRAGDITFVPDNFFRNRLFTPLEGSLKLLKL